MQKRTVHSQWCFFKAGQGCFYSGQVHTRNYKPFTFVYDCGTSLNTTILKKEIGDMKARLAKEANSTIDLLVISHLDADHVNQVSYLLDGTTCKIVILPYLTPINRLFLYFNSDLNDATDDDSFRDFVTDPVAFLIERGAERVIFTTGNEENGIANLVLPNPDEPELDNDESGSNVFTIDIRLIEDLNTDNAEQLSYIAANSGKVEFRQANSVIFAGGFWEFFFYQVDQEPAAILKFRDQITAQFGIPLLDGMLSAVDFKTIFSQKEMVKKLRLKFKYVFKNTNSTGLIVLHGPINHYFTKFKVGGSQKAERHCYTLLSGDTDMRKGYPQYIIERMPSIKVFQVPHHGSDSNWDVSRLADLADCKLIINYGTKNSYGHPGPMVTADIMANLPAWDKIDNTEFNAFCYEIYAYYSVINRTRELAPVGRKHRPVISTAEYQTVDDQQNWPPNTDVRALSLGRAQWNNNDFSIKSWRHVNGHWSRQSEEVPLHRLLDMAIVVVSGMIEEATGTLPGHYLELEIQQQQDIVDLRNFIKNRKGILEERLQELQLLIGQYLDK